MTLHTKEPEQRTAAKVVGFTYLIAMATSMFAELYARGSLIVRGDAVQTAINKLNTVAPSPINTNPI